MQRRAFEHQASAHEETEVPDPVEEDPSVLAQVTMPALVASGEFRFNH